MRLLTGPPGSGKTSAVLDAFREAVRAGRTDIRLLVPTATMADHLEHRLAREGLVFRRRLIQTLSGFIRDFVPELREASEPILYLIVEASARRVRRPEFEPVAHMPGFCASLARAIAEFSSAGCDSRRLAASLPDAPLAAAFLEIYRETERELERRGLVLRAARLLAAAERIEREGARGVREIWLDGFHALPDPELRLIEALAKHAEITLTLEDDGAAPAGLPPAEVKALSPHRRHPAIAIVRAASIERECEEIARRILEQAAAGRPFREMGVIVRAADAYAPLLRATLERFGIPARFYFDSPLERHPAVRYLAGAVEAMLGGWDHAATLAVLRLAPRFADFNALDTLDFKARERIPAAGLDALKELTSSEPIHRRLDSLAALEELRSLTLAPRDWAARLRSLRALYRASVQESADHELALLYRSQAAALDAFDEALDEAAAALEDGAMPLVEFWRALRGVLRIKPLRLEDGRRNVVHVLSAPEARQWVLPVVFVCGMVEKQFPKFHAQDPFFPEAARTRLNAAGIRVRTAAQFEREERALFDRAVSRATLLTVLSYPEFDARGERNLPSLYLDSFAEPHDAPRAVRPQPRSAVPAPAAARIAAPALLDWVRERTAKVSPTALETFLQCPFQYFGTRLLHLKTAPPRPEDRLDFISQGEVVHAVLAAWWREGGDIAAHFDTVFARYAQEHAIPIHSYQTERLRNAMLDDLRAFAADPQWPRNGHASRTEEDFTFELAPGLAIRGKIDRLDVTPAGAYIIDYKYSNGQRTKGRREDENLLQAPLYLLAAEKHFQLHPAGFFYVGVKGEILYVGWSEASILESSPMPADWLPRTAARTLEIAGEIRGGRMEPAPVDGAKCKWCDVRDICRYEPAQAEAPAALAEEA